MLLEDPQYVDCGDTKIAYYEFGHGEPLVLLHGNGEDSGYFQGQISDFTRFFRVIAMDSRGHGKSGRGKGELTFARMAQDLKALLDALGIRKTALLGFSDGGNLALKFTLTYPDYVGRLILNGANVEMLKGVKAHIQLPLYPVYGVLRAFSRVSTRANRRSEVLGLMVHRYDIKMQDLTRISVPTLLIVGEHDMIRASQTREISAHIPGSRVVVFRDGDHFCAAKQPARFNRTVIEFLLGC